MIAVGGKARSDNNLYYVKDNGVGFDMGHAKNLFGIFQRLHPAERFEGKGIGLATVARLVQMHGGEVNAEGNPIKGRRSTSRSPQARHA